MSAKKKAIELVIKMKKYSYCYVGVGLTDNYNDVVAVDYAKRLALIAVAEILSIDILIDEESYVELPSYRGFWLDVRDAIKELKEKDFPLRAVDPFKSGISYSCFHRPTGETWHIIGISEERNKVCAAGYPPSMADLSDCENFIEGGALTSEELTYRKANFGNNWL